MRVHSCDAAPTEPAPVVASAIRHSLCGFLQDDITLLFFRTCTIGMTALPMAASLLSWCSAKTCRKQGQKMTSTQHKHSSTQAQCSWARLDGRHGIAAQHSGLQCYTTTKCSRRHSAASRRTACSSTHLGMALRTLFKLSPTPVAVLMTCCS